MYETVIKFWFEEIDQKLWWKKDAAFDQLITERFSGLHKKALHNELSDWRQSAKGALAEVIILDQFSRNMFRDTPQAFAYDELALDLSQQAIDAGHDKNLTSVENSFLYMPFMHSESAEIHETALMLYEKNGIESNLEFEKRHKAIIDRFGRYPHRNAILGRESSKEEIEFLKQTGSGF